MGSSGVVSEQILARKLVILRGNTADVIRGHIAKQGNTFPILTRL